MDDQKKKADETKSLTADELKHPDDLREALKERSRDRADGRFDGLEDYRGERKDEKVYSEAYELMSISPEADRVHDWGLFQFIACVIVSLAIITYMSIGQREVYFEGMSRYFFDPMGFFKGFILGLLLTLFSNTVRVWSNSLSIIVEANFRHILVDEENEMNQSR